MAKMRKRMLNNSRKTQMEKQHREFFFQIKFKTENMIIFVNFYHNRARSPKPTVSQRICGFLGCYWRALTIVITPILFLPIMLCNDDESRVKAFRCLYVVCTMTIYWVTEAIPLPITGMIPMVAFPVMDVLSTEDTCINYVMFSI